MFSLMYMRQSGVVLASEKILGRRKWPAVTLRHQRMLAPSALVSASPLIKTMFSKGVWVLRLS